MSYSYRKSASGHYVLSCDHCGNVGGVKKRKCPYGYCPAVALCDACYKIRRGEMAEYHEAHCKAASARFQDQKRREAELIAAGEYLRCAALGFDERVKVIFRGLEGKETAFLMTHETYDSIPLLETATIHDYMKHGPCIKANNTDIYKNE